MLVLKSIVFEFNMDKSLLFQAIMKFLSGVVLLCILIFLPAGSFSYWQGWLLSGLLFVPMFFLGLILLIRNPDLLRKRLDAKEKETEQKTLVALFIIMLGYIPVIAKRIRNEEKVLEDGLPGYREYKMRVRYRVIPFVW